MGDFNVNLLNQSHYLFDQLADLRDSFGLSQHVTQPTFFTKANHSLIDHIYSNDANLISNVSNLSPLGACHHCIIQCTLNVSLSKFKPNCRLLWQYSKADWATANHKLSNYFVNEGVNIDTAWNSFHSYFMKTMSECIPRKLIRCKPKDPPWLNADLRHLIKKKHAIFKKWKRTQKSDYYLRYKSIRNVLSNRLKSAKKSFFASLLDNESPSKRFWGYVRSQSGQSSIPDSINYNGCSVTNPYDIANSFSNFFSECFNRAVDSDSSIPNYSVFSSLTHIWCDSNGILKLIRKLKNNSAAGVDGVTSMMLKNTASYVSPILCKLFNLSLTTGSVPCAWKISRVIPIHKSGDRNLVSNYRPISLQPIVCKILERIIHKHILHHLQDNNILTNRQFGFLPKSSTSDALITALHDWYSYLENRNSVAVALFDLTKAFDKVPHGPLLLKLHSAGLNGPLLSWCRSYLSNRTQSVSVHGVSSNPAPVISGVPQGSVLGPLFFLIYVNDLCSSNFSQSSSLVLYADDTTLYKPISSDEDVDQFQSDIDTIQNWFISNHLTANASKTKLMVISTKKDALPNLHLTMNNQIIERVLAVKFLGIHICSNLSWNQQIDHICKKARKITGYIHRCFNSSSPATRRTLYLALVRPIFEYGSITWHPLNKTLSNRLESAQRFAARVILQAWNSSNDDLLLNANLPLLAKRRDIASLCHLYKILNSLCSSPNPFKPHPRPNLRNLNSCALDPPFCRLSLTKNSFYPFAPTLWNYLPENLVKCQTPASFKSAICHHLL